MTDKRIEAARNAFYEGMRKQGYKTFDIAEIDDCALITQIIMAADAVEPEPDRWLLVYEDGDMVTEHFTCKESAIMAYNNALVDYTCSLFARVMDEHGRPAHDTDDVTKPEVTEKTNTITVSREELEEVRNCVMVMRHRDARWIDEPMVRVTLTKLNKLLEDG